MKPSTFLLKNNSFSPKSVSCSEGTKRSGW